MPKIVFSSDELPEQLDDEQRFKLWQDIYLGTVCNFDVKRLEDRPFAMRYEFAQVGNIGLVKCEGTIDRFELTPRHVAANKNASFFLNFNGARPWGMSKPTGEASYAPQAVTFFTNSEAARTEHHLGSSWSGIMLPQNILHALVSNVDDLAWTTLDQNSEPVRHLKRFAEMLLAEGPPEDPRLSQQIEQTLIDLIVLTLGASRDTADIARMRGLRAARLREILNEINLRYTDPRFGTATLAQRLGLSSNYIQKLLHETGTSFTERVLELRLQKARSLLASRHNDGMKVADIALACGFNEVSYFNRRFRNRFGASPTQYRGNEA